MKHSVRVRTREIESWLDLPTDEVVDRLLADAEDFSNAAARLRAPASVVRRAEDAYEHLFMWVRVLEAIRA